MKTTFICPFPIYRARSELATVKKTLASKPNLEIEVTRLSKDVEGAEVIGRVVESQVSIQLADAV